MFFIPSVSHGDTDSTGEKNLADSTGKIQQLKATTLRLLPMISFVDYIRVLERQDWGGKLYKRTNRNRGERGNQSRERKHTRGGKKPRKTEQTKHNPKKNTESRPKNQPRKTEPITEKEEKIEHK